MKIKREELAQALRDTKYPALNSRPLSKAPHHRQLYWLAEADHVVRALKKMKEDK